MLCMGKRTSMHAIVPKEEQGIDFMAIAYPLINDDNEVIGAVGIGRSIENSMKIDETDKIISFSSCYFYLNIKLHKTFISTVVWN